MLQLSSRSVNAQRVDNFTQNRSIDRDARDIILGL